MQIAIENFQSMANTNFTVDGFTAISGRSNLGKSAILRAIKAALFNVSGNGHIRVGTKACTVHVVTDHVDVKWSRNKTSAAYTINGEDFDKPGKSRPEKLEALGFQEIELGAKKCRVQFADQWDPLFLINQTGGVAAELLLSVNKAEQLIEAHKACASDLTKERATLKIRESDLAGYETTATKYTALPETEILLETLRKMQAKVEAKELHVTYLKQAQVALARVKTTLAILSPVKTITLPDPVISLDRLNNMRKVHAALKKYAPLVNLKIAKVPAVPDVQEKIQQVQELRQVQQGLAGKTPPKLPALPELTDVTKALTRLEQLKKLRDAYQEIQITRDEQTHVEEELATIEDGKCPLCGTVAQLCA